MDQTIDDDGFVLWESNTIVRYLAAKHGQGTFCPATPANAPTLIDGWIGRLTHVSPAITPCSGAYPYASGETQHDADQVPAERRGRSSRCWS